MMPCRAKNRNLMSSNCWKCIQIVNPTTTTLVLYHFKFFTIPSGGHFWLLEGGGGVRGVRGVPTGLTSHLVEPRPTGPG